MEVTYSASISNHGGERLKLRIPPPSVIMEERDGSYFFYLHQYSWRRKMEVTYSTSISNHVGERWKLLIPPPSLIIEERDRSNLLHLNQ